MNAERFLYRHFGKILFVFQFFAALLLWYQGRRLGLFASPRPGMDQYTILNAALQMTEGVLPEPGKYLYSPAYTIFLGGLAAVTRGSLHAMRLGQAAVAALIPWMIYRSAIFAGAGRKAGAVAGVLWIFCGSALLISLDFLRAAPLALCFITLFYFLARSFRRGMDCKYSLWAGVMAGLCMLGRENFIPVICLPVFFWVFCRRDFQDQWRRIGIYLGSALLVMLPVLIYNFVHTLSFAILPGNGRNVFEFMQGAGSLSSPGQAAMAVIADIPATVVQILTPFENPNSLSYYAHREAVGLLKIFCLPVTVLFALSLSALRSRKKIVYLLLILITGYFGSLLFCEIYYRFRTPALPLLCLCGGIGVIQMHQMVMKKERKIFLFILPVLAALYFSLTLVPERKIPRSEREVTVRFFLDRKMYDRAGELLLKYRSCGVPLPDGERILLYLLVKAQKTQEAVYWHNCFRSGVR